MTADRHAVAIEGVRFFGEMCASISHEFKNVLAIINENAGLLEDMLRLGERGMPLDLERLSRLAGALARQVARGDGIAKGMNRFAHSADTATEMVDVGELVRFMAHLTTRLIALRGKPPSIEIPSGAVTMATNRFFLENLIWRCLVRALAACPPDRAVSIRADQSERQVRIRYCGLDGEALLAGSEAPSDGEAAVADLLGAQLKIDKSRGEIVIILTTV